jgi:hypothetical protein
MKITSLQEDLIKFDNGSYLIFEHYQDCCEHVYADCENIQSLSTENFPYNEVEFNEPPEFFMEDGVGVVLVAKTGMKYLVSCYNKQNGYYSDNLSMSFVNANGERTLLKDDVQKSDEIY